MFLLLHNCCLCILYSLSCDCGLSIQKILDPVIFLLITQTVRFPSFLGRQLRFRSYAAQCSECSDPVCLQGTLAFIRLMMWSYGYLSQFDVFAHQKWRKFLFRSIYQCMLCRPCCWAICWMLHDMDHMEASCVLYVKVGRFHQI